MDGSTGHEKWVQSWEGLLTGQLWKMPGATLVVVGALRALHSPIPNPSTTPSPTHHSTSDPGLLTASKSSEKHFHPSVRFPKYGQVMRLDHPEAGTAYYTSCCGRTKTIFIVHVEDCTTGLENGNAVEVGFKSSWESFIRPHDLSRVENRSYVSAPSHWSLLPSIPIYVASRAILRTFQDREDGPRPSHTRNNPLLTHLHIYA